MTVWGSGPIIPASPVFLITTPMTLRTLAIVGVGLIGGSIALAARARGVAARIIGVGPSAFHLEKACQQGMLDAWHTDLQSICDADAVVICTPVDQVANQVAEVAVWARPDTLITDVGSTKAIIVRNLIAQLREGVCFVGGHPLAGSEKNGPQFADAQLFQNRLVILTPNVHFHPEAVIRATALWGALGARVKVMTPEEHDRAMAFTSHLPHLLAAALAAMLPVELRELTASGFRDTTRVAGGDPQLWTAIFQQNEVSLTEALTQFCKSLERCFIDWRFLDQNYLKELLIDGKRSRDALGS
jgi:prephenate dehydrogenase